MRHIKRGIKWFKGFFEEGTPQSMMRLLAFTVTINGCGLAWVHSDYETLVLGLVTLGLTGKGAQKFIENAKKRKDTVPDNPDSVL